MKSLGRLAKPLLKLAKNALEKLGFYPYQAQKASQLFLMHDAETFDELYNHRKDRKMYISLAKQRTAELERLMKFDETGSTNISSSDW
jgi:hypothetical protein